MIVDYEALLLKYIRHVGECEGVPFINERRGFWHESDVQFTDAEWAELNRLKALSENDK